MSLDVQLQNQKSKIDYFKSKYRSDGQRSLSPQSQPSTASYQSKRVQSGRLRFKVNSHNFVKQPKELLGGGFYKRSQLYNSTPMLRSSFEEGSLPLIEGPQSMVKVTNNLALIQEETDDHPGPKSSHHRELESQKRVSQLQRENQDLQNALSACRLECEAHKREIYGYQTRSLVEQVQYFLQGAHHCHFEEQTFELFARLRQTDEILARTRTELDKVIGMVKNYNNEGLMTRILDLEQLLKDLDGERESMGVEIEMLGLQRDDWQQKYQSIQNKLIKMQGTEVRLEDAEKKVKMQGDTLEKLTRRLKEKQIEVQDWQRKCLTGEQEKNKRIAELEQQQRQTQQQLQSSSKHLQSHQDHLQDLTNELHTKTEMLEEEKRKTKQLHTEIVDMRVNRIVGLQEEIAKQKKIIQQRVDEIEENEDKIKQLNRKIDLLETQLKNIDEVTEQKLNQKEQDWSKKYKELERQNVQLKRENNTMEIQIQESEIFLQQKQQECEDSSRRIQELLRDQEQQRQVQTKLLNKITENEQLIEEKEQKILELKLEIDQQEAKQEQQLNYIAELEGKKAEHEKIIEQQGNQIEGYKAHVDSLSRYVDQLKQQIEALNQQITKMQLRIDEEVRKVEYEREKIAKLRDEAKVLEERIEERNAKVNELEKAVVAEQTTVKTLEARIVEIQQKDKFLSEKLRKELEKCEAELKSEREKAANLGSQLETSMAESARSKETLANQLQERDTKISTLQAELFTQKQQVTALTKRDKELNDTNAKLIERNQVLQQAETELADYKLQMQDFEKILKQFQTTKEELARTSLDRDTKSTQLRTIEASLASLQAQQSADTELHRNNVDHLTKQNSVLQKQLRRQENELQEAHHKIELLMDAMEGMHDKTVQVVEKKQDTSQPMERVKQVFVDERQFLKKEDCVQVRFEELKFATRGEAHLTVSFWVRIASKPLKEMFPLLRIVSGTQQLLELGVHLDSGNVYATYHMRDPKEQLLTVTSQLTIKLAQFAQIVLVLNENGQNMDIGLCLNGVRDDQVSVFSTVIVPEAMLIIGTVDDVEKQRVVTPGTRNERQVTPRPKYTIRDVMILTKEMPKTNVFKQLYQAFSPIYNPERSRSSRRSQQPPPVQRYFSSGEFIYLLMQQEQIVKPHTQPRRDRSAKSRSPPPTYQVHNPIKFKGHMIPSNLMGACDLLVEQQTRKTEIKSEEHLPTEIETPWTRKKAIQTLKKMIDSNYAIRGLFRPIMQHYQYLCTALQLMSPCVQDSGPLLPVQTHLAEIIPLVKLVQQPLYLISLNTFLYLLEQSGLQRISKPQLLDVCNQLEILIEKEGVHYLHYDHLMIILREVVMNRAEATMMKYNEKKSKIKAEEVADSPDGHAQPFRKRFKRYRVVSGAISAEEIVEVPEQLVIRKLQMHRQANLTVLKACYDQKVVDILTMEGQQEQPTQEIVLNNLKQLNLHYLDSKLTQLGFVFVDGKQEQLVFTNQTDQATMHLIDVEDQQLLSLVFDGGNLALTTMSFYQEPTLRPLKSRTAESQEAEEDLDTLELMPLPEGWNQGVFSLVLNRCRNCEKHAHTTRHKETDFTEKSAQIQAILKEMFPNVEISENVDKLARLECFEIYIKGVGSRDWMDKEGRCFLYFKNESVPTFVKEFDSRIPRIYEKLALLISVYGTSQAMGEEQDKFLRKKPMEK